MEAEPSRRRLRAPNPLSDCTNTISSTTTLATAASSQSSSSSTVKLKRQNPKLASITDYLLSALELKPSVVPPPIPSTHPRPHPVSSSSSDGQFMVVAEAADFVHIYSTKADYKVRQEIDFFGDISGVSMSPDDESLYIGIWDRTIWREKSMTSQDEEVILSLGFAGFRVDFCFCFPLFLSIVQEVSVFSSVFLGWIVVFCVGKKVGGVGFSLLFFCKF